MSMYGHESETTLESLISFSVMLCRVVFIAWVIALCADRFLTAYPAFAPLAAWNSPPVQIVAIIAVLFTGFYDLVWNKRS